MRWADGASCPERMAHVPFAAVCIDRFEARLVEGRAEPADGVLPSEAPSWHVAREACEAVGARLCTTEEWQRACRGEEERAYPYGEEFDPEACNTAEADTDLATVAVAAGGSHERCVTPEGVYDLSGNLMEWYADEVLPGSWGIGGGSFAVPANEVLCVRRAPLSQPRETPGIGFRCCVDPRPGRR